MDVSGFGFWQYLGLAVLAIVIFAAVDIAIKARKAGVSFGAELGIVKASPQAQALSADATALWAKVQTEFTALHGKLNAALAATAPAALPPVGTVSFDVWDAVLPFASTSNPLVVDGNIIRSGTGAPITFKTSPAVAPATQATVTRTA